jgi:sarcosine oxidase
VTVGGSSRDADVAIVGLGALGSAAAYWASRRPGLQVVALEQYQVGHPYGASEDVSRIVRLSYHRREYVRLARRAFETWAEVEREAQRQVIVRTGGLDVGPLETADGAAIDLSEYVAAMDAERVPFERLDAAEIMRRWPAWRLDERHTGLFQADAGLADPSQGNAAHRELARVQGAELREHARVVGVSEAHGEVAIALADGSHIRAGSVILATDAWTNELLAPLGLELPLTVTQEQVSWFGPSGDPGLFAPSRFPIWIWMDEPSFYGFPTWSLGGPKIGQDVGGKSVTPATRTFERDPDAWARTTAFLGEHLPAMASGSVLQTKTCLYTLTPDRDFVLDRLPGHARIWLVLGSAHAYKFASVLGRILVELAIDGGSPSQGELGPFAFDRPILRDPDPVTTFVV